MSDHKEEKPFSQQEGKEMPAIKPPENTESLAAVQLKEAATTLAEVADHVTEQLKLETGRRKIAQAWNKDYAAERERLFKKIERLEDQVTVLRTQLEQRQGEIDSVTEILTKTASQIRRLTQKHFLTSTVKKVANVMACQAEQCVQWQRSLRAERISGDEGDSR